MPDIRLVDLHFTDGEDATCVHEIGDTQLMRLRLAPGAELGSHNSIADLLLIPVTGAVRLKSGDSCEVFGPGQALSVPYDTPMEIGNAVADEPTNVLIIKTPHPRKMK